MEEETLGLGAGTPPQELLDCRGWGAHFAPEPPRTAQTAAALWCLGAILLMTHESRNEDILGIPRNLG